MNRIFLVSAVCSMLFLGCNQGENDKKEIRENVALMSHGLAEKEELFRKHCITCHTLRYIEMQPDFPRKTWEKITDKMIKTFGAEIPDSSAAEIVDYLMAIKGSKE